MGYTIVYDKKFIRLSDGKIIPMVLAGSNNCTMYVGGREIRERYWCIFPDSLAFKTEEEILEYVTNQFNSNPEIFMEHGKWVGSEEIVKWYKNAIKNANTIENILSMNPCRNIECFVWAKHKATYNHKSRLISKWVKTEADLLAWLEEAREYIDKADDKAEYDYYIHYAFDGIDPIRCPKAVDDKVYDEFVVKCHRNDYIYSYNERSYSYGGDKASAQVFHGKDEWEALCKYVKHFSGMQTIKPVALSALAHEAVKPFYVVVDGGIYNGYPICKTTARHLVFANKSLTSKMMKFETEKQALNYIAKLKAKCYENCKEFKVCKLEA